MQSSHVRENPRGRSGSIRDTRIRTSFFLTFLACPGITTRNSNGTNLPRPRSPRSGGCLRIFGSSSDVLRSGDVTNARKYTPSALRTNLRHPSTFTIDNVDLDYANKFRHPPFFPPFPSCTSRSCPPHRLPARYLRGDVTCNLRYRRIRRVQATLNINNHLQWRYETLMRFISFHVSSSGWFCAALKLKTNYTVVFRTGFAESL